MSCARIVLLNGKRTESDSSFFHVRRDRQIAKFWLNPVSLARNDGFRQHELDRIARLVVQYEAILVEAWNDYFDPQE